MRESWTAEEAEIKNYISRKSVDVEAIGKATKKGSTFPVKKVATVCLVIFVNTVSLRMVYPFLPFMVKDFYPEVNINLFLFLIVR